MGLGVEIPNSCKECKILLTCMIAPRWWTTETAKRLERERMKNCPYNAFVGRNDDEAKMEEKT